MFSDNDIQQISHNNLDQKYLNTIRIPLSSVVFCGFKGVSKQKNLLHMHDSKIYKSDIFDMDNFSWFLYGGMPTGLIKLWEPNIVDIDGMHGEYNISSKNYILVTYYGCQESKMQCLVLHAWRQL